MSIDKDQVWKNKVDLISVLVLRVDDFRVYYQNDRFIHNRYKYEFLEEFDFENHQKSGSKESEKAEV